MKQLNLDLIKEFEGLRLKAYRCPQGVWTIGYGSTYYPDGSRVKANDEITESQADEMLKHHVQHEIIEKLDQDLLAKLHIEQLSALCSLIYRIGITSFNKSFLKAHILNKHYKHINNNWDWLGNNPLIHRGLCLRVSKEKALFFSTNLK